MTPGQFASDTTPARTGGGHDGSTSLFHAPIAEGWDIGGNANGGYLLALAARGMAAHLGRADPVTITAHYLSPGTVGPATLEVTTERAGRRFSTASAHLVAERPVLSVLGTFGDLAEAEGPVLVTAAPPELPPPSECVPLGHSAQGDPAASGPPPLQMRIDLRLHPDDAGFFLGSPSGVARVRGWFDLLDGEPVDPFALLLALDAFPPTAFNAQLPVAWVPTVEFTAHIRRRPDPGPLACEFTTRFVSGGFLEEDGVIWDAEGRVIAQSRQLALTPRPG